MKQLNSHSSHDQNWQWPEKTWFRERLNALKARESEERRKPVVGSVSSEQMADPVPADKADLKVD